MSNSSLVIGGPDGADCKPIGWDSMASNIGWDSMTDKSSDASYANIAEIAMMNVNSKSTHCSQYEVNYGLTKYISSVCKCQQVSASGCQWSTLSWLGSCMGSVFDKFAIGLVSVCIGLDSVRVGSRYVWNMFGIGLGSFRDRRWVGLGWIWC